MDKEVVGTLLLVRSRSSVEARLLREHPSCTDTSTPLEVVQLPRTDAEVAAFASRLRENWQVQPLGVLWRPADRSGTRRADYTELLRGINPYRPSERQQAGIVRRQPDRALVVEAEPATVRDLWDAWEEEGNEPRQQGGFAFAAHVARRARLSLERAERRQLGPVYKSPRLVKEEILASRRFHDSLEHLAGEIGADKVSVERAAEFLTELSTGWSRLAADLIPAISRRTFEKGFDPTIEMDPGEVDRLRTTLEEQATIFLWSHRSNMDNPVLTLALHDQGLPLPHTFAGINMAFGPIGPLYRRAGTIFIRRNIGDDPLYKHVLQEVVGYLVERRFDLSWSIEGTRSRTGKMLPPKLGLLSYAAKAYLDGRIDDIALQPVSIAFDQLDEIEEYASYARGAGKQAEGMGWLLGYLRKQQKRHYGKAYVRYPEPVSMREFLGDPGGEIAQDPAKRRLALQKMAFEVAWRVNQATTVTPTALITSVLLGSRGLGLTARQVHGALQPTLDHLDRVGLPVASGVALLRERDGVEVALDALAAGGPVTAVRRGHDTVWLISPADQLAATFYRNSVIHVFLNAAIAEVAAMAAGVAAAAGHDPEPELWRVAYRLRDLLKFEFYFNDKERQHHDLQREMERFDADWREVLRGGTGPVGEMLTARLPLTAAFTIRPFLESYAIVADTLTGYDQLPERKQIVKDALGLGEQYVAQRRVSSSEPVSALLFDTGLQLFAAQGLLEDAEDRVERTRAIRTELRGILGLIVRVERRAEEAFINHHAPLPGVRPSLRVVREQPEEPEEG